MATKKKSLQNGLKSSLAEEEKKVEDKFKIAEKHFKNKGDKVISKSPKKTVEVKEKLVQKQKEYAIRDAFTFPPSDHALFNEIKKKSMKIGVDVNKSEIVRAGLHVLNNLPKSDLEAALEIIEKLKTGRKAKTI